MPTAQRWGETFRAAGVVTPLVRPQSMEEETDMHLKRLREEAEEEHRPPAHPAQLVSFGVTGAAALCRTPLQLPNY